MNLIQTLMKKTKQSSLLCPEVRCSHPPGLFFAQISIYSMITCCPQCGHSLPNPIIHGIASCNNCRRVFDSSPYNRILSAAWFVRRHHIENRESLIMKHGYDPWVVDLVLELVADQLCNHEDLVKVLKEEKICAQFPCEDQICAMCDHYKITLDLAS